MAESQTPVTIERPLTQFYWINQPEVIALGEDNLLFRTLPSTDFWQKTHFGLELDNSPAFVTDITGDFTFTVHASFELKELFDQIGIVVYQNSENWIKAAVEIGQNGATTIGAVVTNFGYSDWSSVDLPAPITEQWFRISRKGQDFLIENSADGITFQQMRLFHMHQPIDVARVGVYACGPLKSSSYLAKFTNFSFTESIWKN